MTKKEQFFVSYCENKSFDQNKSKVYDKQVNRCQTHKTNQTVATQKCRLMPTNDY